MRQVPRLVNIFYPSIAPRRLPTMLRIALTGAIVAGIYGALHDQISFAISPEYFTRMKFRQFHWADSGLPPRAFASVVGFLATWWAGLIAGWLLARSGLDELPAALRNRKQRHAFAITIICAAAIGSCGALIGGYESRGDLSGWQTYRDAYAIRDLPGFVIVAWLHGSGYVGTCLGVVIAIVSVRRDLSFRRTSAAT